jgi:hypothetical protein
MEGALKLSSVAGAIRMALRIAAVYAVFVLALFAVRGAEPFRRIPGGIVSVLAFYVFCALTAGAIVGALGQWVRRWYAAMIVGAVAALPAGFAVAALAVPPERWARDYVLVALLFACYLGPLCGLGYWFVVRRVSGG